MSKGYLNYFHIIFLTMLITAINTMTENDQISVSPITASYDAEAKFQRLVYS